MPFLRSGMERGLNGMESGDEDSDDEDEDGGGLFARSYQEGSRRA